MSTPLKFVKSIVVTDALLTATSVAEADHPTYSAATTYALAARVILNHVIYESLQAGNLAKAPATEPDWWSAVSPTNRWKLFDFSSSTQTLVDTSDYYEFTPGQAVNAVALINTSGLLTVRVRLTDPSFGVVYDTGLLDVAPKPPSATWYSWFFEPRTEQTQLVLSELPSYPNAVLRIDVTTTTTGLIGGLVFGSQRSLGMGVQQGARLGITDYSRKERNDWGDTVLVQRAFSKRASFQLLVSNADLDATFAMLADMRATPCLWMGSSNLGSLVVFGFYSNFDIGIAYANYSECSIDIEGLT